MTTTFIPAITPHSDNAEPAYWYIFNGFRLLVHSGGSDLQVPLVMDSAELPVDLLRKQFLGYLQQDDMMIRCYSGEVADDAQSPPGMTFLGLRQLFSRLDDMTLSIAGRAVQIKEWDRTHQYCGQCGSTVTQIAYERAKRCPQCGHTTYPRLSPAIIVSVERAAGSGTELLLARNQRHPKSFFSVLAGFVEPGESLEECVRREVCEEVSIDVENIRYFGSQPWPFPNSLMIAFTADYAGGEIILEEEELAEAGWFRADELPMVPPPISIARQLIDAFVEKNSVKSNTIKQ